MSTIPVDSFDYVISYIQKVILIENIKINNKTKTDCVTVSITIYTSERKSRIKRKRKRIYTIPENVKNKSSKLFSRKGK